MKCLICDEELSFEELRFGMKTCFSGFECSSRKLRKIEENSFVGIRERTKLVIEKVFRKIGFRLGND